jgi:predicted TIM-barrel fold metal-dependent hydrolase
MSEKTRIDSCDDHLDIYHLPPTLWSDRLPAKYKEAGPRVTERDGMKLWTIGDNTLGVSGKIDAYATSRRTDIEDDGFRPADPVRRLDDMDYDDIHSSIVYGPGALFGFPTDDPELKKLTLAAWNDWAATEFNSHAPDRLSALPALPATTPKDAIDELHRVVSLGHKGVLFRVHDLDLNHIRGEWDALWAALAESGVPVSFHIGGGSNIQLSATASYDGDRWIIPAYAAPAPLQLDEPLAAMIFSGVLEDYPALKLVLAESGIGWLPWFVTRMDGIFEKHCAPHPDVSIKTLPSELFNRQVWATFEEEPLGAQLIPLLSPDNFMWACDYPHPDSTWPNSRAAIDEALGTLDAETIQKVTSDNCRKLYGIP